MTINKYFKKLNIEPISEVDIREKCEFANKVSVVLVDRLKNVNLDYLRIVDALQHTKMYISRIPKHLSPVNYSYIDGGMYISEDIDLDVNNEFVLHEVIHKIQEYRNKKEKLIQLGLCDIMETKIKGLALNEAAIQYLVQKVLNGNVETVNIYDMKVPTLSKDYYPLLTNLVQQLAFFVGEDKLVDSTINSNNEFKYEIIDYLGEDTYNSIENGFEQILEAKNAILKSDDQTFINNKTEFIKKIYNELQKKTMQAYFNNEFKRVKTIEQLKVLTKKLLDYKDYIGSKETQDFYAEYFNQMQEKIKSKEQMLINKSLIVVKENKFVNLIKKVKNYLKNLVFQN